MGTDDGRACTAFTAGSGSNSSSGLSRGHATAESIGTNDSSNDATDSCAPYHRDYSQGEAAGHPPSRRGADYYAYDTGRTYIGFLQPSRASAG